MDLTKIVEYTNPLISAFFGAPGLWAFIKSKTDRNNTEQDMLLAVSKNQLISLGRTYLDRGYITMDEYEEFEREYKLYSSMGGNGLARRVFKQVDDLPIMPNNIDGRNNR